MDTYARIDAGRVVEVFESDQAPTALFHPSLDWRIVPAPPPGFGVNWTCAEGAFHPPAPAAEPAPFVTLDALQTQLAALAAAVSALTPHR